MLGLIIYMAMVPNAGVGYMCSKPMPLAEAKAYLASHPPVISNGIREIVTSYDPDFALYVQRCADMDRAMGRAAQTEEGE